MAAADGETRPPLKTEKIPCHDQQQSLTVDLPPMTTVILRCVRRNPRAQAQGGEGPPPKRPPPAPKGKKASEPKAEKPIRPPAQEDFQITTQAPAVPFPAETDER